MVCRTKVHAGDPVDPRLDDERLRLLYAAVRAFPGDAARRGEDEDLQLADSAAKAEEARIILEKLKVG